MAINKTQYTKRLDYLTKEIKSQVKKIALLQKKYESLQKQTAYLRGKTLVVSLSEYKNIISENSSIYFDLESLQKQNRDYIIESKILEDVLNIKECEIIEFKRTKAVKV